MPQENEAQIIVVGSHGEYRWLSSAVHSLHTIVTCCPQVFLGRWLAVVSTDSGDPKWWAAQLEGWKCRGGIAYSPRLTKLDGIVHQTDGYDNAGFDEWYVFDEPRDLGRVIGDENPYTEEGAPSAGRILGFVNRYYSVRYEDNSHAAMFGEQVERLKPESYIADGADEITFVSRDAELFSKVLMSITATAGDR